MELAWLNDANNHDSSATNSDDIRAENTLVVRFEYPTVTPTAIAESTTRNNRAARAREALRLRESDENIEPTVSNDHHLLLVQLDYRFFS